VASLVALAMGAVTLGRGNEPRDRHLWMELHFSLSLGNFIERMQKCAIPRSFRYFFHPRSARYTWQDLLWNDIFRKEKPLAREK